MKSKSQTTISRRPPISRRLPARRPPTHPGEMIREEFLKPLGMTQSDLARRLKISPSRLGEIIRRKQSVSPEMALRLARVLDMPADFWLGLQQDWDLWHAMRDPQTAEIRKLAPIEHQGPA